MNIKHSSKSVEWYTPSAIIELVHLTIGLPDLDPASSSKANETVKATNILTESDDGLESPWTHDNPISVYCNPPGSKIGNKSQTALFWERLMSYRAEGLLTEAVFMGFSIETLAVTQGCSKAMTDFTCCIPRKRIRFVDTDGNRSSPTHGNVIVYVHGTTDNRPLFADTFRTLGSILAPY